jgi:hypothetical protein
MGSRQHSVLESISTGSLRLHSGQALLRVAARFADGNYAQDDRGIGYCIGGAEDDHWG